MSSRDRSRVKRKKIQEPPVGARCCGKYGVRQKDKNTFEKSGVCFSERVGLDGASSVQAPVSVVGRKKNGWALGEHVLRRRDALSVFPARLCDRGYV